MRNNKNSAALCIDPNSAKNKKTKKNACTCRYICLPHFETAALPTSGCSPFIPTTVHTTPAIPCTHTPQLHTQHDTNCPPPTASCRRTPETAATQSHAHDPLPEPPTIPIFNNASLMFNSIVRIFHYGCPRHSTRASGGFPNHRSRFSSVKTPLRQAHRRPRPHFLISVSA